MNNNKIKIIIFFFSVFFMFSSTVSATNTTVTETGNIIFEEFKDVTDKFILNGTIKIDGSVPKLINYSDKKKQEAVNSKIISYYNEVIKASELSKYIKKILFTCEIKSNREKNTKSIFIRASVTSSTTRTQLKAFTFNDTTGELLTLTSDKALGASGVIIANSFINNEIINKPDKYNIVFKQISDDTNFYIYDSVICVLHSDKEFLIDTKFLIKSILSKNNYKIRQAQDLKLIPLRQVCEDLGYTLTWNNKTKSTEIKKDNNVITSVEIGNKNYTKDKIKRILESPPLLEEGLTYVPISFFDQILDINYFIQNSGTITFSYYTN